jgi:hypothetical protein
MAAEQIPSRRTELRMPLGQARLSAPPPSSDAQPARIAMRTYYFDMKDGVPTRDRQGIEFASAGGAIEHSKELALRLRNDSRLADRALAVVVVDESGAEIHREPVYPEPAAAVVPHDKQTRRGERG